MDELSWKEAARTPNNPQYSQIPIVGNWIAHIPLSPFLLSDGTPPTLGYLHFVSLKGLREGKGFPLLLLLALVEITK